MKIQTRQDLEEMVVHSLELEKTSDTPRDVELIISLQTVGIPREGSFDYYKGLIHAYQDFCQTEAPTSSQMFAVCWIVAFCRLYSAERIKITRWD